MGRRAGLCIFLAIAGLGASSLPALAKGAGVFEATPRSVPVRVPSGYRAVWQDDRLNPHRGPRTAQGDAQMAGVWTDQVPMRLAPPTAPRFLRLGIYDTSETARPTVRLLRDMGFPVSRGIGRRGGRPVEVIYAGPFDDPAALARAEARLAHAGFHDLEYRK
ncbi:hypothetical protein NHN26_15295 [Rhodovulum tesquicola]|uniref:hypothetical protein n=1 Tax=Rhodovulum tesquicola TaxID=540254 RepID=UPI0020986634|nr:hypothetical protein [Rhodovulum tesquicola]MCO8146583.1 hypothetical protein [Rhodovulum tesquicola]